MKSFQLSAVLVLIGGSFTASAQAITLINNGLAPPNPANVFALTDNRPLVVRNAGCPQFSTICANPGAATTVEAAAGSVANIARVQDTSHLFVRGYVTSLRARGSSTVDLSGGAGGLFARGQSAVTVTGSVHPITLIEQATLTFEGAGGRFQSFDSAQVFIRGNAILGGGSASGDSQVFLEGGFLTSSLRIEDNAILVMTGGSVKNVSFRGSGQSRISGGIAGGRGVDGSATLRWSGGSLVPPSGGSLPLPPGRIYGVGPLATLEIVGTDFAVDGTPVGLGELTASSGLLTGTLSSGETLGLMFFRQGRILLLPEPHVLGLLVLAMLAVGSGRSSGRRSSR